MKVEILYFVMTSRELQLNSYFCHIFISIAQTRTISALWCFYVFTFVSMCSTLSSHLSQDEKLLSFPVFLCLLTNVEMNARCHDLFIGKEGEISALMHKSRVSALWCFYLFTLSQCAQLYLSR